MKLGLVGVALLLAACGGSSSPASAGQPATKQAPASSQVAAQGGSAGSAQVEGASDPGNDSILGALRTLEGMPTQDELDAAAAARITEADADSEYDRLKLEIEGDLAKLINGG